MTWTKIGDEFPAAARNLSDAAFRTHMESLCWSNSRLLDLMIPKHEVRRFAETADPATAVEELVAKGWWQDCGDAGYNIGCRFADWQLDRAVIEKRKADAALRRRRSRLHGADDHSLCENCAAAMRDRTRDETRDKTRDETRDKTRDKTRDPGRVGSGTGRDQLRPREEQEAGAAPRAHEQADVPEVRQEDLLCPRARAGDDNCVCEECYGRTWGSTP